MMIKLLIILFIILLALLGVFMLTHLEKPFFLFDQQHLVSVQKIMKITGYLLLITSIIGVFILLLAPLSFNLVTLVLGSVITGGFAVIISRFS
ncbi:hypothetical protein [Bombilactobacillus bombi]|nr:hypothetical protein [Bombilactobacillus bombi]